MSLIDEMRMAHIRAGVSAVIHPCNCIGPQNGDPVCPCQMRSVSIRDGRYVMERDLGPAPTASGSSRSAGSDEQGGS